MVQSAPGVSSVADRYAPTGQATRHVRRRLSRILWGSINTALRGLVAAGLLVPLGIDLPMAVGAIAMSLSKIIVAANAQLLRRVQVRFEPNPVPVAVAPPA